MAEAAIIAMTEHEGRPLALVSLFEPVDPHSAASLLALGPAPGETDVTELFRAADTISSVLSAADGTLWAASGAGVVWTTAPAIEMADPPPHRAGAVSPVASAPPHLARLGVAPTITGIWGFGTAAMAAICFEGSVLVCSDGNWREFWEGDGAPLAVIGGVSPQDFVVAGAGDLVVRFRKGKPERMAMDLDGASISALGVGPDGALWAGDTEGRLRVLDEDGFELSYELGQTIIGLAAYGGALYAATAGEVWRIKDEEASVVLDDMAVGMVAGGVSGLRIVPNEEGPPRYMEMSHDAGGEEQWRWVKLPISAG